MSESCLVCPLCKIQFPGVPSDNSLVNHLTQFHDYQQCLLCEDQVFVEKHKIQDHVAKKHQDDPRRDLVHTSRKRKLEDDSTETPPERHRKSMDLDHSETSGPKKTERSGDDKSVSNPASASTAESVQSAQGGSDNALAADSDFRVNKLTQGVYSRPSKYDKDPLVNFWYSAICECLVCPNRPSRKFSSHNAWLQHIKYSHNMSKPEYRQKFGNPDITGYKHHCFICYKSLSFNPSIVRKHLQLVHRMEMEEYNKRFRDMLMEEKRHRPMIPSSRVLEGWWEGCMFSCKHCSYTVPGQTSLEHHLTLVHKFAPTAIKDDYGEICTLIRFHQCFMCSRIIKHDYKSIYHHLQAHKTDIDTYANKFLEKIKAELTDKGMEYVIEKDEEIKNSPSLEEYLSRRKGEDSQDGFEERLMKDWFDYCEYRCSLCQEVSFSHLKFHLHIVRQHKLANIKAYRDKYGDPDTIHRLHKCFLCSNNVKWEASRIRDHLKNSHKITGKNSLKEYGEKFKDQILNEFRRLETASQNTETPPVRFGQSFIGGSKKEFTNKEWKSLVQRKHHRSDKMSCPECRITINRSSFTRHLQRTHPFHQINEERELRAVRGESVQYPGEEEHEETEEANVDEPEEEPLEDSQQISFEEPVLEEVVLKAGPEEEGEDTSPRYLIDQESGEILVLEGGPVDADQGKVILENENISLLICDNLERNSKPDEPEGSTSEAESACKVVHAASEEPEEDVLESDDQESEFETGPLDGRIVEINSPSHDNSENNFQLIEMETCDGEDSVSYQQIVRSEAERTVTQSVDEPLHAKQTDEGSSADAYSSNLVDQANEEATQTLFINKEENQEYLWSNVKEECETRVTENGEANIFSADKSLESIILSNVEGVQQIAIVRKKSAEQFRFDRKTLLEHISNILKDDQKIFNENSEPLKIIEIEVDQKSGQQVKNDNSKVSKIAHAYAIKSISGPMDVFPNKFSIGTQISRWTKLAGERQKIARHKCVRPRAYREVGKYDARDRISRSVDHEENSAEDRHYSSRGTQVTHDVSRGLVNDEEDEEIRDRIIAYIQAGHILDRTCPGCSKVLAKPKNLIVHLQSQHCVRLAGSLGEALDAKQQKENEVRTCPVCNATLSRKSLRRHLRTKHNQ